MRQSKLIVIFDADTPYGRSVAQSALAYNNEEKQRLRNQAAAQLFVEQQEPEVEGTGPHPDAIGPLGYNVSARWSQDGRLQTSGLGSPRLTAFSSTDPNSPFCSSSSSSDEDKAKGQPLDQGIRTFTPKANVHAPLGSRKFSDHLPPSLTSPVVKPLISNVPNNTSTSTVLVDHNGVVHPVGAQPINVRSLESRRLDRGVDDHGNNLLNTSIGSERSSRRDSSTVATLLAGGGDGPSPSVRTPRAGSIAFDNGSTSGETVARSEEAGAVSTAAKIESIVDERFVVPFVIRGFFDVAEHSAATIEQWQKDLGAEEGHWLQGELIDIRGRGTDLLPALQGVYGLFFSYFDSKSLPMVGQEAWAKRIIDLASAGRVSHLIVCLLADWSHSLDAQPDDQEPPRSIKESRSVREYAHKAATTSDPSNEGNEVSLAVTTLSPVLPFETIFQHSILSFKRPRPNAFVLSSHLPVDSYLPFSCLQDVGPATLLAFLGDSDEVEDGEPGQEKFAGLDVGLVCDSIQIRQAAAQADQVIYHSHRRCEVEEATATTMARDEEDAAEVLNDTFEEQRAEVIAPSFPSASGSSPDRGPRIAAGSIGGPTVDEKDSQHRQWFLDRGLQECYELMKYWASRPLPMLNLRKKTKWRLTAWRHYVVEHVDSLLVGWRDQDSFWSASLPEGSRFAPSTTSDVALRPSDMLMHLSLPGPESAGFLAPFGVGVATTELQGAVGTGVGGGSSSAQSAAAKGRERMIEAMEVLRSLDMEATRGSFRE